MILRSSLSAAMPPPRRRQFCGWVGVRVSAQFGTVPILPAGLMAYFWQCYVPDVAAALADPLTRETSHLLLVDRSAAAPRMAPCAVLTCAFDVLRDEGGRDLVSSRRVSRLVRGSRLRTMTTMTTMTNHPEPRANDH